MRFNFALGLGWQWKTVGSLDTYIPAAFTEEARSINFQPGLLSVCLISNKSNQEVFAGSITKKKATVLLVKLKKELLYFFTHLRKWCCEVLRIIKFLWTMIYVTHLSTLVNDGFCTTNNELKSNSTEKNVFILRQRKMELDVLQMLDSQVRRKRKGLSRWQVWGFFSC